MENNGGNGESKSSSQDGKTFGNKEYGYKEKKFIQDTLDQEIGSKFLSKRKGYGRNYFYYLETWRAISLANKIFGFNGWSSRITEISIDYCDERNFAFYVGCSAIVRITLKDGSYHEDLGYGSSEKQKNKGKALEMAKKTAVSDALKRTLRNFGKMLGLSIYDKQFLGSVKSGEYRKEAVGTNKVETNPNFKDGNTNNGNNQPPQVYQQKMYNNVNIPVKNHQNPQMRNHNTNNQRQPNFGNRNSPPNMRNQNRSPPTVAMQQNHSPNRGMNGQNQQKPMYQPQGMGQGQGFNPQRGMNGRFVGNKRKNEDHFVTNPNNPKKMKFQ